MTRETFAELCRIFAPNVYKNCLMNEEFMNSRISEAVKVPKVVYKIKKEKK